MRALPKKIAPAGWHDWYVFPTLQLATQESSNISLYNGKDII